MRNILDFLVEKRKIKVLLDSDLICYSVGFACEQESEFSLVKRIIDEYINRRLDAVGSRDCELYLTDSKGNFRNRILENYKAQRKSLKPFWYDHIRMYLQDAWDAETIPGIEADDCIGIMSYQYGLENCIIVSNDKDLDQLPGYHMNMSNFNKYEIDEWQGCKNLYKQWLVGDRIDNIPGIFLVGPKRAESILKDCKNEEELRQVCQEALRKVEGEVGKLWTNRWKNLLCLHLMRTPEQYEYLVTENSIEELENWMSGYNVIDIA